MNRVSKSFIIVGAVLLLTAFVSFQRSQAAIFEATETDTGQQFGVCLDAPDPKLNPDASQKFLEDHKECAGIDCTTAENSVEAFCISESQGGTGLAKTSLTGTGITHTENFGDYIIKLVNFALPYLVLAAFVGYVAAGFIYVTSFGNEEMLNKSKKILIWSTVGLILVILSYAITTVLTSALVEGLNTKPPQP